MMACFHRMCSACEHSLFVVNLECIKGHQRDTNMEQRPLQELARDL